MNFIREYEEKLGHRPFWFMRQSGRYLKEYHDIRNQYGINFAFRNPEAIIKLTELPLKYFNPDFLILYTDILLSLNLLGMNVDYEENLKIKGIESAGTELKKTFKESVEAIKKHFPEKPLMGITGGPFTLMSYVYDGHGNDYFKTKKEIIEKGDKIEGFVDASYNFAKFQLDSGCDIVQIFESWVGNMSPADYLDFLHPYENMLIEKLRLLNKPIIFFGRNTHHLLKYIVDLRFHVLGLDWNYDLYELSKEYPWLSVQGNLDPSYLFLENNNLENKVIETLRLGSRFQGHIFNLGHGVPPNADVNKLILISKVIGNYEK